MLSICIPIYNFDCSELVQHLLLQASQLEEQVEIVVIDDASEPEFQKKLSHLSSKINFTQLTENVGRSKIRNLLSEKASFEYLLFIDGDSTIISEQFLDKYLQLLDDQPTKGVICGGSIYQQEAPNSDYLLRWKYSKARERKPSEFLEKNPYQSFTTNNFVIDKKTFQEILFDERIVDYGHEDTLFGFELMKRGIKVNHIQNEVLNGELDRNEQYLDKVRLSIANLLKIASYLEYAPEFIRLVPLLRIYLRLKLVGLEIFLQIWFKINRRRLEKKFEQGKVNLMSFDLYRLGVMSFLFKRT